MAEASNEQPPHGYATLATGDAPAKLSRVSSFAEALHADRRFSDDAVDEVAGMGDGPATRTSINGLTPHEKWLTQPVYVGFFSLVSVGVFVLCLWTPPLPDLAMRLVYSLVAVSLLFYRLQYY